MIKRSNNHLTRLELQDLMLYRVHEILLVASPYDAFILEEDGRLTEQILNEYLAMNFYQSPRLWIQGDGRYAPVRVIFSGDGIYDCLVCCGWDMVHEEGYIVVPWNTFNTTPTWQWFCR